MTYHVVITQEALNQTEAAYRWIAERAPIAAARWFTRLQGTIQTLETQPKRCPLAPESKSLGIELRQLLYGKRRGVYRVLFTITRKTVTVLHVLHGAQQLLSIEDLQEWLLDDEAE